MTNYAEIEFVDYGAQGEYGLFGKVVARSDVRDLSQDEIDAEISYMKYTFGDHVEARMVEEICPCGATVNDEPASVSECGCTL